MTDNDLYDQIADAKGATKRCSACDTEHPITEFAFKSKASGKLHSQCRAAQRHRSNTWYEANREQHGANVRERRKIIVSEVGAMVDGWLKVQSCPCGGANERLTAVGSDGVNLRQTVKDGWSPADIEAELRHAVARCLPCRTSAGISQSEA